MPSCGKSSLGREISKKTLRKFVDTDVIIKETYGRDPETGHGVGHISSVHEGPNTISPRGGNIAFLLFCSTIVTSFHLYKGAKHDSHLTPLYILCSCSQKIFYFAISIQYYYSSKESIMLLSFVSGESEREVRTTGAAAPTTTPAILA